MDNIKILEFGIPTMFYDRNINTNFPINKRILDSIKKKLIIKSFDNEEGKIIAENDGELVPFFDAWATYLDNKRSNCIGLEMRDKHICFPDEIAKIIMTANDIIIERNIAMINLELNYSSDNNVMLNVKFEILAILPPADKDDLKIDNPTYKIGDKLYHEESRLHFNTEDELNNFIKDHNIINYKRIYNKVFNQFNLYPLVERTEKLKIENIDLPKFIITLLKLPELINKIDIIKKELQLFKTSDNELKGYTNNKEIMDFFKFWYDGINPLIPGLSNDYHGQKGKTLIKSVYNEISHIYIKDHGMYTVQLNHLREDNSALEIIFNMDSIAEGVMYHE